MLNKNRSIIKSIENDENDNIYVNIEIKNLKDNNISGYPATFFQNRTKSIIDKANEYYCSVIRFTIPNFFVPLHIMPIQSNQANANLSDYSITLEYDGDVQQEYLIYVSSGVIPSPTPPSLNPNGKQSVSPYYFIFEYQSVVNMINTAFLNAFTNLATKPLGSEQPIMTYDSLTNKFQILAQSDYYDHTLANPIKVYFNEQLQTIINGFPSYFANIGASSLNTFSPTGRDEQLLITNNYNNYVSSASSNLPFSGDPYYILYEEYSSIFSWNPFKRIALTTNSIPVESEYVQGPSDNQTLKILTDFSPISDNEIRTTWQYFPSGQYRLIDMISEQEVKKLDLQIIWIDQYDNYYQLEIPWNQQCTIKLAFLRKDLYKNSRLPITV
jgi:hypothetical protein